VFIRKNSNQLIQITKKNENTNNSIVKNLIVKTFIFSNIKMEDEEIKTIQKENFNEIKNNIFKIQKKKDPFW
jgi:hypothetical protein